MNKLLKFRKSEPEAIVVILEIAKQFEDSLKSPKTITIT
jgi:hypothetical protein